MPEGMVARRPIDYIEQDGFPIVLQTGWEWKTFLGLYREKFVRASDKPIRVLEIGSYQGGTLRDFIRYAPDGSEFVVVTLEPRSEWVAEWHNWAAQKEARLEVFDMNSQEQRTADIVSKFGPFDVIMYDADHSYPGVSRDWSLYGPFCKPGGWHVFHDVTPREGCGVSQLWDEIREQGYVTREIIADRRSLIHGIGIAIAGTEMP